MATATNDDLALQALDFDPRCEWQARADTKKCGAVATWAMLVNCGDSAQFCQPHQERMDAQLFGQGTAVYCSRHPEAGRVLFDWRPLI